MQLDDRERGEVRRHASRGDLYARQSPVVVCACMYVQVLLLLHT